MGLVLLLAAVTAARIAVSARVEPSARLRAEARGARVQVAKGSIAPVEVRGMGRGLVRITALADGTPPGQNRIVMVSESP